VSEPASISAGIAARYSRALFDLAREEGALNTLEADIATLAAALADSAELRSVITSPVISREDQANAIGAIAQKAALAPITAKTLALMAAKRRLYVLPQLLAGISDLIAADKGEVTAEVASAVALSSDQAQKLSAALKAQVGKEVKLKTTVDESLIGGLVVKLGSTMIDTSIKAKLSALQNAMKEVG
jgi:F-type H+-transporting ATPase subunit delta